ncbi:TlpA family protein disulfide reductase [Allosphingosinicella sp.]|uniref:TlpA family protein disulfide reductase n=1 Tax=Allosphingosinicella sp. TaxID=2823234 RepID=UPI003D74EB3C
MIVRLLALGALLLPGCDRQKAGEPQGGGPAADSNSVKAQRHPTGVLDRSHAGTPAPDIEFEDPDGEPASLADFRGRPLLVNLWATWCPPCIVEMPSLDALAEREGDRLHVLALSQDLAGRRKVADFFAERRFRRLDPYLDGEMAFMTSLRLQTLPTSILYDARGREVWRMTGMEDWQGERARRLLREAAGGR